MFMGLARAYALEGDFKVIWVLSHKRMGPFLWGNYPLEIRCKDFNFAIGEGLGWMKWLKIGTGKGFIFH